MDALTMRLARLAATLAVMAAASACRDATGSSTRTLTLELRRNTVSAEEETIAVGDTIRLRAITLRATGDEVTPAPRARWSSTDASVASVDTAGLVTGLKVGSAKIVATVDSRADTVQVNVANRVTGTAPCTSANALNLDVGQVRTFTGEQAMDLCFAGGTAARAEYALVAFNASEVAGALLTLTLRDSALSAVFGPPSPALSPSFNLQNEPRSNEEFHDRLREESSRALEPRLRMGAGLVPSAPNFTRIPSVNDLLTFNVRTTAGDGCTQARDDRKGRVVYISDRAIVVADTANPKGTGTFSDADYQHFGETFDTLVWRIDTENFGEPTDIDDNDRVIIFITRAVNELTGPNSNSYVAGFFYNRDLFSRTGSNACAGSNAAEMFYAMAPDPRGEVNGNRRSYTFVRTNTVGVLAHEFQHLINDSRRLYVNRAPVWEETWLNEGLSHIAEELMFYAASGLAPGSNVDSMTLKQTRVAQAYNLYSADNVDRLITYLQRPHDGSLIGADELSTRGAAWSFLRYAADRLPGEDRGIWKALVASRTRGLANLRAVLGVNPRDWIEDWGVAIYTDDSGLSVEAEYQQPSWNLRSLTPSLRGAAGIPLYNRYPLGTLQVRGPVQTLRGGGHAYFRFGVAANAVGGIRTTVAELPPPARLRLSVVRTR